jgi:hypothetical protein
MRNVFFAVKTTLPALSERRPKPKAASDRVKTPYPNLIRYKPSGNYFGRVRVNGKLIRRTLEATVQVVHAGRGSAGESALFGSAGHLVLVDELALMVPHGVYLQGFC